MTIQTMGYFFKIHVVRENIGPSSYTEFKLLYRVLTFTSIHGFFQPLPQTTDNHQGTLSGTLYINFYQTRQQLKRGGLIFFEMNNNIKWSGLE